MNIINLLRRMPIALLALLVGGALQAQNTEFFVEDVTARVDEEVRVNVRGIAIDSMVGFQLSMNWDTLALEYLGVTNIALDGAPEENFNRTEIDSGRIGYFEVDLSLEGVGLPDSSLLFTLRFEAVSTVSTETMITFVDEPLGVSVTDRDNESIDPLLNAGMVTLEGSNSIPAYAEDPRFTVAPNPFSDFSRLTVRLNYNDDGWLELMDIAGRTILRRPWSLRSGVNNFDLRAADFPADGTFIVRITTDREQLHRKLVLQRRR